MRRLFPILRKEFLALSRDWHGLAILFLMPAAFILIMSLALRDAYSIGPAASVSLAVLDLDQTVASRALAQSLAPAPESPQSLAELRQMIYARGLDAGVVIAAGYQTALAAPSVGHPVVQVLADPAARSAAIGALRGRLDGRIAEQRALALLAGAGIVPPTTAAGREDPHAVRADAFLDFEFVTRDARRALNSTQQNVPAWLVFGMFFVVIPICHVFIREKQDGTLARLATLRVSVPLLIAGKVLPFAVVNAIQTAIMLLVGRFLVPAFGGEPLSLAVDWPAFLLVALAVSSAAIGFALLVAAATRTTEQATALGSLANILFAALGGIMVPRPVMPPAMQDLARFSPMNWGLEGFLEVFARGGGLAEVWRFALVLAATGLACALLAALALRRQMGR